MKEYMVSMFLTKLYIILYFTAKKIYRLKTCTLSRALGRFSTTQSLRFQIFCVFSSFVMMKLFVLCTVKCNVDKHRPI